MVISIVPLKLEKVDNNVKEIVWENLRYSSPLFCRPILFEFTKETSEKTREYITDIQNQLQTLSPTTLAIENTQFSVQHDLLLTMINGNV